MLNKHLKRYLMTLLIRKMQIKTMMHYLFIPTSTAKIQKRQARYRWVTSAILATLETEIRKIKVGENNQSKMGWRCASNSRAPALQARSP
jgi:hypothetical protein